MLKNGQIITGRIQYIDDMGNGVIKHGHDQVLIRGVFVKEEVRVMIKKRIAKGYVAEIKQIVKADKERVVSPCSIYERCGSCHCMHMSMAAQQVLKKQEIINLCRKEKLSLQVSSVLTMKNPYAYRNKVIIGFSMDKKREIQAGFYEEFSHRIIPYKRCLLHPKICDDIIATIVKLLKQFRIDIYDEKRRSGLLRHVLLRYGEVTNEIMVVFVMNASVFPARKHVVQALIKAHPEITTVIQNINTRKTSVVLGNEERILYGPGYIEDKLCGQRFRISAKSFYQINHTQTEVLYQRAVALLTLTGKERVLDAYCGIGTIGMYASQFVKEVIGVEINKDAIIDAKINAKLNAIDNIRFICDDAGTYMQKLAGRKEKLDVVIMDPPRSGSNEDFIRSVSVVKASQVLYISCNPETQLRDIKIFQRYGYRVEGELLPVDMFPFTSHVESVCLMTRKEK